MSTFYKRKELDQIAMLMETYQVMLRDEYLLQEKKAINLCHFGQRAACSSGCFLLNFKWFHAARRVM